VHDVEVVAQRKVLVDDLDAEGVGGLGRVDVHLVAVVDVLPRVVRVDAGEALDQGALAGAVVTDQRGDLAGTDVEVDPPQDLDRPEALVDASQRKERRVARLG
jgi:hypothetical protein